MPEKSGPTCRACSTGKSQKREAETQQRINHVSLATNSGKATEILIAQRQCSSGSPGQARFSLAGRTLEKWRSSRTSILE